MTSKRKYRSTSEYLKYLKGELSPGDRYAFERELEADPFGKEALEGMEQVSDRELEEDLLSLHAGLQKRLSRRRRRTWYYVAASVASLLIVGTVFLNIYEFDPETAPESLPGDHIYLQEDAGADRETPAPETAEAEEAEAEAEEAESDMGLIQEEARVPEEEIIVEKTGLERDVSTRRIRQTEIADRNEPVVDEAEPDVAENELVVAEAEPVMNMAEPVMNMAEPVVAKAAGATDPAEIAPEVRAREVEARTPAPAAGAVPGVEAQPDLAVSDEVVVIGYEDGKPADPGDKAKQVRLESKEYTYQRAEPEGGLESFNMYIEEQIRFPAGDSLSKREVVVLRFNVARDGSISGIQTLRSPGSMYTEEAIRLLQEGPLWNPARNESGTTDEKVRMRIVFER